MVPVKRWPSRGVSTTVLGALVLNERRDDSAGPMHHILPDWTAANWSAGKTRRWKSFSRVSHTSLLSGTLHSVGLIFAFSWARGPHSVLSKRVDSISCYVLAAFFWEVFHLAHFFFWFQHFILSYFAASNIYTVAVISRISRPCSFWQNEGQHGLRIATRAQFFLAVYECSSNHPGSLKYLNGGPSCERDNQASLCLKISCRFCTLSVLNRLISNWASSLLRFLDFPLCVFWN